MLGSDAHPFAAPCFRSVYLPCLTRSQDTGEFGSGYCTGSLGFDSSKPIVPARPSPLSSRFFSESSQVSTAIELVQFVPLELRFFQFFQCFQQGMSHTRLEEFDSR